MGASKTDLFNERQLELALLFKALAHPARVAIIQQVLNENACICNDLSEEIGLAQPTVSQHLRELKNAGLIVGRIEGKSVCYCVNTDRWDLLRREMSALFDGEKKNNGQFCQ